MDLDNVARERSTISGGRRDDGDDLPYELYEKLNNGDVDAVEKLLAAYEPQLRALVRRQLPQSFRAKFDSSDVMQSVWASILQGLRDEGLQFAGEAHLRSFLIRMALFRFVDLRRHHRNSLGRERSLALVDETSLCTAPNDQPNEIVQAHELLDELRKRCNPAHHELLRLRAMGYSLAEIAERTGFHESSVRRIFYDLARRIGTDQDASQDGSQPRESKPRP